MLVAQRHTKIVELIQENGSVQVEELAERLKVSTMTIRRDLIKLQNAGVIERCHGGAVAKLEIAYKDKQTSHKDEKKRLAKRAALYVSPGDHVFLDAGTTTYEIARLIKNIPDIQIVTNDFAIAGLIQSSEAELLFCGGLVQKSTGSTWGYFATQMLAGLKFDVGFFGAACINAACEVLTPTIDKAFFKDKAVKQCDRAYLVVDTSKFEKQSTTVIHNLAAFTGVITDRVFHPKEQERIEAIKASIIAV